MASLWGPGSGMWWFKYVSSMVNAMVRRYGLVGIRVALWEEVHQHHCVGGL